MFEAKERLTCKNLAFEHGVFRDVEPSGGKLIGEGKDSVTWILEDEAWKIQCYTWSMPVRP